MPRFGSTAADVKLLNDEYRNIGVRGRLQKIDYAPVACISRSICGPVWGLGSDGLG